MTSFTKDVLYPGTYWVSDGQGGKKKVQYSRADVAALRQRMQDMLSAGLSIPLAAEHQDKAKPLTDEERKAEWVKQLTMGWAEGAELAPEGFLTAKVAVPVEDDAKRLPAVRFVSPEIVNDFVDGSGRKWPGPSITHLAVTPRPVNAQQRPFEPVRMGEIVRLSLAEHEGEKMADEKEGDKKKGAEGKEEKPKEAKVEKPKEESGLDLAGLRGVLEGDGYSVPGHITEPGEFLKHLHTAALSKKAMIDKLLDDDDDDKEPPADNGQLPEGVTPENGPVLMSLGGHKVQLVRAARPAKKPDQPTPQKKGPNPMSDKADPRVAGLEQALLNREKKDLQSRITALFQSGRITKPIHDKLAQDVGTVRMSLTEAGTLDSNAVVAKVEAYEALPENASWPPNGALPEGVVPAPEQSGWSGHESREQVNQSVEDFYSMLPGAAAAQK